MRGVNQAGRVSKTKGARIGFRQRFAIGKAIVRLVAGRATDCRIAGKPGIKKQSFPQSCLTRIYLDDRHGAK